jgi:hypothetical protein
MRRLEIKYLVENISTLFEEATVSWSNAEFTFNKDFSGHFSLWEDGIEPERVWETLRKLEERAESFRAALRYLGNHSIEFRQEGPPTYYFDAREFTPRTEGEMAIITDYLRGRRESFMLGYAELPMPTISMTVTSSPAPLPRSMPFIPHDLHRMAETLVAADALSKYPDLVLKLAFLILEDLKGKSALNIEEGKMSLARDFVSHPICTYAKVVAFVEAELPSAKVDDGVQFRRNDHGHMAFVAKYAYPALQRAKELFNEKVSAEGGSLGR